ncbi:hypothetical protein [Mycobacterium bourgelatii]|uniref:Transposase n=1 Tax=Mycobacterium bourgelatii TaxID=1273442 RepID=A0A7I9YXN5_MYCBU|nr:hypothetical protein [Mycobacterium bourgelatii]GFG93342.1 hypothetical protein MBOU_53840 [Mycobacterium bourgelatii]
MRPSLSWLRKWIFFTRSRPYNKNDQATVESKTNHLVRKYAFYYRHDTGEERAVLNRLWPLVNDRLNYLTPRINPSDTPAATAGAGAGMTHRRPHSTGSWPPTLFHQHNRPN